MIVLIVMMPEKKNLLLFRLGGLGDLLVSFPSIYLLRKKFSSCSISLVCRKDYGLILKETEVVDKLISEDEGRLAPLFAGVSSVESELSQWLHKFDFIIGWMKKKSRLLLEKYLLSSGIRNFRFFGHEKENREEISKFFFNRTGEIFDKQNSIPSFDQCFLLPLNSCQKEDGLKLLGPKVFWAGKRIVVIHPGSGSRQKCWPLDNFLGLIHRLNLKDLRGVLVTGRAETWLEDELKDSDWPQNWVWLQNPALLKLAGLLSESSFYVGNDSGISHLAAASGTKVLALFRQDSEQLWKPAGRVTTISANSLAEIKLKHVWAKVKEWL